MSRRPYLGAPQAPSLREFRPSDRAPDPAPAARAGEFRADIEGLRALAVLLVVLFHAGVAGFSGGFVGVDVFFVISGYLITGILCRELEQTGTIRVTRFLARRIRRLLPAASTVLVATLLVGTVAVPPLEMMRVAASTRAAAAYFSNIHFLALASDYFNGDVRTDPLLHTWSLSVEEQFYIVWPWILLLAWRIGRRYASDRRTLGWMLTATALASFVLACRYTALRPSTAFYSTPLRAWEFAAGGIAWLASTRTTRSARLTKLAATLGGLGGLALILIATVTFSSATEFPGLSAAIPVLGTALVLISGDRPSSASRSAASRLLSCRPAQWIGKRSYSWYLWHWPALTLGIAVQPTETIDAKLGLLAAALALSSLTYRYIESPMRTRGRTSMDARRTIAIGVSMSVAVVVLATATDHWALVSSRRPEQAAFAAAADDVAAPHRDGCVNGTSDDRVRVCEYGDRSDTTVALFGDSHAVQWFPAAESFARSRHWRLLVVAKTRCATANVPVYDLDTGRRFPECERWRAAAVDSLKRRRPALVLLSNATRYIGRSNAEPGTVTPARWESGLAEQIRGLHDSGIPTAIISDTPLLRRSVPVCLARSGWLRRITNQCDAARVDALRDDVRRAEARAAASVPGTRVLDLTDNLCATLLCTGVVAGQVAYSDREHLTATMAEALAPAFTARLKDLSR